MKRQSRSGTFLMDENSQLDQVKPMWIPQLGQYYIRTSDHLALNCWGIFMVREPGLSVVIREIKPGFVQRHKIFPTLVLDGTQQIQAAF
jgi:hypothetical protein